MNRTTNFLIESWLDSAHIATHDQRRCKTLRYFASTGFCPIRALYTYIRLSLGREPCPYTQMFRSASIVTRTFVIRYLASYTSFLRSFFSLPFILSNNYPINENKDGCSTSLDRSRSQLHHFASLPCSFFFVRVCVCFFFFVYTWPGNGALSCPLRSNTRPAIRSSPLLRDPIVIARLVITS